MPKDTTSAAQAKTRKPNHTTSPNVTSIAAPITMRASLASRKKAVSAYSVMMPASPKQRGARSGFAYVSRDECMKRARSFIDGGAGEVIDVDSSISEQRAVPELMKKVGERCERCNGLMWVPVASGSNTCSHLVCHTCAIYGLMDGGLCWVCDEPMTQAMHVDKVVMKATQEKTDIDGKDIFRLDAIEAVIAQFFHLKQEEEFIQGRSG